MIFAYVGNTVDSAGISTASLVTFLTCFTTFLAGLGQLAATATQIAGMRPLYEFAAPILRAIPENDIGGTDPGRLRGDVSFNDVRFAYKDDGPTILNGIDLHIGAGEYVAIVGDSGCGKSTVLRLLMAFETPQAGTVTVDGFELNSVDKRALRRQFGVVMQNAKLMPGTIYDNIVGTNYGMSLSEVTRAAELVGLADDVRDMPMGYQTAVSDSTGGLSGGQVQRILLARAIVSSPTILILDEATSALDNRTQAIVTKALDDLTSTRIVVAHRLSTVMKADRIVVLNHGQVVENGSYEELMTADGHFAALARRQLN
jgi:ABC-type bacteriocin/lantibiotic exporter with double-glycine peptidase domain